MLITDPDAIGRLLVAVSQSLNSVTLLKDPIYDPKVATITALMV